MIGYAPHARTQTTDPLESDLKAKHCRGHSEGGKTLGLEGVGYSFNRIGEGETS